MSDKAEVWRDTGPGGSWHHADVLRVDRNLGVYCVGHRSSAGTVWVVRERLLRFVAKAIKVAIAAMVA